MCLITEINEWAVEYFQIYNKLPDVPYYATEEAIKEQTTNRYGISDWVKGIPLVLSTVVGRVIVKDRADDDILHLPIEQLQNTVPGVELLQIFENNYVDYTADTRYSVIYKQFGVVECIKCFRTGENWVHSKIIKLKKESKPIVTIDWSEHG